MWLSKLITSIWTENRRPGGRFLVNCFLYCCLATIRKKKCTALFYVHKPPLRKGSVFCILLSLSDLPLKLLNTPHQQCAEVKDLQSSAACSSRLKRLLWFQHTHYFHKRKQCLQPFWRAPQKAAPMFSGSWVPQIYLGTLWEHHQGGSIFMCSSRVLCSKDYD